MKRPDREPDRTRVTGVFPEKHGTFDWEWDLPGWTLIRRYSQGRKIAWHLRRRR